MIGNGVRLRAVCVIRRPSDGDGMTQPRLDWITSAAGGLGERREGKEKHANSALTADSKGVRRVHENEIPPRPSSSFSEWRTMARPQPAWARENPRVLRFLNYRYLSLLLSTGTLHETTVPFL